MTLDQDNSNLMLQIFESLNSQDSDSVRQVLETIYNGVMLLEREKALGAAAYERTNSRSDYANGFKDKNFHTRMGKLELQVPQTRNTDFYPACLEKGSRSERALKLAVAEMYLKGVSTRKVAAITKELCGLEISSTQVSAMTKELDGEFAAFRNRPLAQKFAYVYFDATYLKVRHDGAVTDQACLIAYGVNAQGKREILGVSMELSEAEVHWRSFFESLQSRGLHGVQLFTGDYHAGLRAALRTVFPSVPFQRCQFHMMQNAQAYAPKKLMRSDLVEAMRSVFDCSSQAAVDEAKRQVVERYSKSAPKFVEWFERSIDEGLTCLKFPQAHRKKIRTTNGLERVNREIKRRTRVAMLFPNEDSALRLVTGILVEIHEEWVTGRNYLDMSKLEVDCDT